MALSQDEEILRNTLVALAGVTGAVTTALYNQGGLRLRVYDPPTGRLMRGWVDLSAAMSVADEGRRRGADDNTFHPLILAILDCYAGLLKDQTILPDQRRRFGIELLAALRGLGFNVEYAKAVYGDPYTIAP